MLETKGVWVETGGHALLAGIDVALEPGQVTVVIGPNGAGKTTLLRVLSGEIAPTRGEARLDGRHLGSFSASELARRRAVVPQASALAFAFTVREVVMLGVTVPGFQLADTAARAEADAALGAMGLLDLADRLHPTLSGGERQRVHVARALCQLGLAPHRPRETHCFLLDEPTSSLDLAHQAHVMAAMRRQADLGHVVVSILHDLNLAAALADRLLLIASGRLIAAGRPGEVLQDELLSASYGCRVTANRVPVDGRPFVLPPSALSDTYRPRSHGDR
jgi:iron complex transport system ATP-binding protein